MTGKSDGGPVYPTTPEHEPRCNGSSGKGVSLRDYFAGQALAGAMSTVGNVLAIAFKDMAKDCYDAADAMITERGKS